MSGQFSTVWVACGLYVDEHSLISRFLFSYIYLTLCDCVFCMLIFKLHKCVVKSLCCILNVF